jgi:asparaginyl-tRNA synthetase
MEQKPLKNEYVYIKNKERIVNLQSLILQKLSNYFLEEGFKWILPVITSKVTDPLWPDPGASIEKRLEFEIYGEKVRITQSMIVHKIIAVSLFTDKIFTFSPNLRIEKPERKNTGKHLYEFTQLDFEVRYAKSQDIISFVERILKKLFIDLMENGIYRKEMECIKEKWETYDSMDIESIYGREWEQILANKIECPVWIKNIPREFYDYQDPLTGKWDNYDLYLPGIGEVLSGSKREILYDRIIEKMVRDRINKENFMVLLDLSKNGELKDCAGAGIGIERLLAWIAGEKNVANVQLFPRIPGMVDYL